MKKIILFLYAACAVFLFTGVTGCGSSHYDGSSTYYRGSSTYYGGSWGYDSYYRSGVDRHYDRSATRARVSHSRGTVSRPSGGGGGRGGGGRGRR